MNTRLRREFIAWALPVLAAVTLLCVGCNDKKPGSGGSTDTTGTANFEGPKSGKIKIVSSLPRTGSAKGQTDTIVNGIKLALEEAGHKAGDFAIAYEDLDDATAAEGKWTAEKEAANAEQAIKDPDVMVYIGTYNSGA